MMRCFLGNQLAHEQWVRRLREVQCATMPRDSTSSGNFGDAQKMDRRSLRLTPSPAKPFPNLCASVTMHSDSLPS
ncbi:hypothetical protein IG631_16194 [Alternaria alternata]|nr:hypothetical protein IG631_16194 [Alternaria alternata]